MPELFGKISPLWTVRLHNLAAPCDLQNLCLARTMPGAVLCQAAQILTLYVPSSVPSQRLNKTPTQILVLLFCASSNSPITCPTNSSCPGSLKSQSLVSSPSRTSALSLGATLCAEVWKVPTGRKLGYMSSSRVFLSQGSQPVRS